MKRRLFTVLLCAMIFGLTPLSAQVPRSISYQGILSDAVSGKPIEGKHTISVRLYDSPAASRPLWSEEHFVSMSGGLFNVILGEKVPLAIKFDRQYYVAISVDGGSENVRVAFAAAPYALYAAEAEALSKGAVTSLNGDVGEVSLVGGSGVKVGGGGGVIRVELDKDVISKGEEFQVPPTGAAGGDLSGTYPNPLIGSSKVTTTKIADGAITAGKLGTSSVITVKVSDNAITTAKIANDAVTTAKIAAGAITSTEIANNAVITTKIADNAVTTAKIISNAVTTSELADNAVTAVKVANNAVTTVKVIDGAITTPKLADKSVTPAKISTTGASIGDVLTYSGSSVVWGTPGGGGGSVSFSGSVPMDNMIARYDGVTGALIQNSGLVIDDLVGSSVQLRAASPSLTNMTFAVNPKGSGALQGNLTGSIRGAYATDWQRARAVTGQVASGDYSVIGGGLSNSAGGDYAVVSGGNTNSASGISASIGGGTSNTASGQHSAVAGGNGNMANSLGSTVGGGISNTSSANYTTVGGGNSNTSSANYATVGGGNGNIASMIGATVSGGSDNKSQGNYSTSGGGSGNTASGNYSLVGGGFNNTASGLNSTVSGGSTNRATHTNSFIGGGLNNLSSNISSTVSGGQNNIASGITSTIGGGTDNTASGNNSTIGGGMQNLVVGNFSTVGGGYLNKIYDIYSTIGGGRYNEVRGEESTVGGGDKNFITNTDSATIGGGAKNTIETESDASTIGGGMDNTVTSNSLVGTIGGGRGNTVNNTDSATIGGGAFNSILNESDGSTIGGGHDNTINATTSSFIGGGGGNTLQNNGSYNVIGGGNSNTIDNTDSATISGGAKNSILDESDASTIGGGADNTITTTSLLGTIGGGWQNSVTNTDSATISGGAKNIILDESDGSTIGGGSDNTIATTSLLGTIGGGRLNYIDNTDSATISGGAKNSILDESDGSTIGGGADNTVDAVSLASSIGGGQSNTINNGAVYSTISGGNLNNIAATHATVGGGNDNNIASGGNYSSILGGNTNDIGAATHATVGGGNDNNIASGGNYSSILGGNTNDIGTATHATVGGGNDNNIASGANYGAVTGGASNNINGGTHNFIGGGESNTITTGNWNAVLGGKSNTVVSGNYSGILGGLNNTATGDLAFALGTGNTAAANGFALGNTSTAVANEFSATYSAGFKFVGEGTANKNFTATFINRSTNTQATPLQGDYSGDATPTGPANGIAIQLMPTATNISNDYIRFINGSNAVVGRIEGQSVADLLSDSEHLHFLRELDYAIDNAEGEIVSAGIALGFAIADGVIGSAEIIQSSLDEGGRIVCGGATLGGCASIAATGAVDVILKVANVVMYAANIAVAAVDLNDAIEGKKDAEQLKCSYDTMVANNIGVTYESGSADYAEWLPKSNLSEKFGISDIVGVRGGKISKNTDGAEQFMVVSMKPIVLGNTPAEGKAQDYEKVAFMGQVPVRVLGPVKLGDYILPSDGGNGLGIAVAPSNMRVEDYKKIVGVAWSAGSNPDLNTVRVAVGLNTNSLATMIEKQNSEMLAMKESMSQMNSALASLVPGYSKMMNVPASSPVQNSADYLDKIFSSLNAGQSLPPVTNTSITSVADGKPISDISVPSTFFNDDVMSKAFADAQAAFVKGGGDVSTHPFFSKVAYDPAFREIAMRKIQNQLNKAAFDQMIQNASANAVKK